MSDVISAEDFAAIGEKLKRTNEDNTPFPVVKDNEISVIGDPNKTEVKKNDYEIKFRMPKSMFTEKPDGAQEIGSLYVLTVKYKDISITPRNDLKIVEAIMRIQPFFNKLKEDGGIETYTKEELFSLYAYAGDDVHIAMYNLVATFLGIDDKSGEYMLPMSVLDTINTIMDTHPEIFNEADVFFG